MVRIYHQKCSYPLRNKLNKITIAGIILSTLTTVAMNNVFAEESTLPSWFKITTSWWGEDKISDQDFINSLQYLVENQILLIPKPEIITGPGCVPGTGFDVLDGICEIPEPAPAGVFPTSFEAHQKVVLSWMKITASWWGEDKISDQDFINALQYLVENQILLIAEPEIITQPQWEPEPKILPITIPELPNLYGNIDRIDGFRVQGHPTVDSYYLQFRLINEDGTAISADGTVSISIMDKSNRILYLDGFSVRRADFTTTYETFSGEEIVIYSWEIPVSEIQKGFGSLGIVNLVFTDRMDNSYSNKFDGISIPQFS